MYSPTSRRLSDWGVQFIVGPIVVLTTFGLFLLGWMCAPILFWREHRRRMGLKRRGRTIDWVDALRLASDDAGTFVVQRAYPYGFQDLWFIAVPLRELDPAGTIPRWGTLPRPGHDTSRAAFNRLDVLAPVAKRVQWPLFRGLYVSQELTRMPTVEAPDFVHLAATWGIS